MSPSALRAEYERLAAAVKVAKPGSAEHKALMAAKLVAHGAWYAVKDQPEPEPVKAKPTPPLPVFEVTVPIMLEPGDTIHPVEPEPTPEEPRPRRNRRNR
jgi:hypothetical protein